MVPYYKKHLFLCTNQREDGTPCCGDYNTRKIRKDIKAKIKQAGLHKEGEIRINSAGCLGRCDEGPMMVIYPEGVWYHFVDQEDINEIIESHLLNNKIVERLKK